MELRGAISGSKPLPHWIAHNQYGFFNTGSSDGYIRGEVKKNLLSKNNFSINTEIDILGKTDGAILHEAYLNFRWQNAELRIGKNEVNNAGFPDDLSSGHLFESRNAPTIPKIYGGFFEYTDVPFSRGYLQFRGGMSHSILEEDRDVKHPFYHEKFAYLKLVNLLPINIYAGATHNALYGGELNGEKLSSKWWEVVRGANSSDSDVSGDDQNAAGAHFGTLDYGLEIPTSEMDLNVYYHQPWSDGSGFIHGGHIDKDYMLGIHVKLKNQKFITEILYENVNTTDQSGEGLSDPVVNGVGYTYADLRPLDYDAFVFNELGIQTNNLTWDEFIEILKQETNNGLEFGGRDSYYVNTSYPKGNTYKDFTIGNSLFLTAKRLMEMTGETMTDASFIINNRIQAHHMGMKGEIFDIKYKVLVTFTENYGTYAGKYGGSKFSWILDKEYYFRNGVNTRYYFLSLEKKLENAPVNLEFAIAYDEDGFGRFPGTIFGIQYILK